MSLAFFGPDIVDLAMCLWGNVGLPSILYGCEIITFSKSAIDEIERHQSAVGKFNLGLPLNAPNISSSCILGIKPFRELLYTAQLKYLLRLFNQDSRRWSKDAFLDHLNGTWNSKYIKYMTDLRDEVGLKRWPRSIKEIKLSLEAHFLKRTNVEIDRLDLPALEPLAKRARMEFVNETKESQVNTPCMFLADSHISIPIVLNFSYYFFFLYLRTSLNLNQVHKYTNCFEFLLLFLSLLENFPQFEPGAIHCRESYMQHPLYPGTVGPCLNIQLSYFFPI